MLTAIILKAVSWLVTAAMFLGFILAQSPGNGC